LVDCKKIRAAYVDLVKSLDDNLTRDLAALASQSPLSNHFCPACGRALRFFHRKERTYWGCSGFPACAVICADDAGKPGRLMKTAEGAAMGPSEKQLALAEQLAQQIGGPVPPAARKDVKALNEWIEKAKAKRRQDPATDSQLIWVRKFIEKGDDPPVVWPDAVTREAAHAYLEAQFAKHGVEDRRARK
jgi:DNA topoisomerase I